MVPKADAAGDAPAPPSESEMAAVLGDAHSAFQALLSHGGSATVSEWRRSSKSSPWLLKVSQGKRTLFYARPDSGRLKVTVLLGQRAVEAALGGQVSKQLHPSIREAKVFPEGRPISVWISRPSDVGKVEELLSVKLAAMTTKAKAGTAKSRPRAGRTRG